VAIIGIIASITVPGLLAARISANEASAVGSLRAVASGEAAFSSSCASGAYAVTLDDLAKAPTGSVQGFISPDLGTNGVAKSGYVVAVAQDAASGTTAMSAVTTCNDATTTPATSYFARASPVTVGGTGRRYFATDTRGTIFYSSATIANPITVTTVVQ
jgi:type II secretory pathway pseudopilin PulG